MKSLFSGLLLFYVAAPYAAELETVETTQADDIYVVNLSMLVDTPEAYLRSVLTDPARFTAANPAIEKVEYLPQQPNGHLRFRDTVHVCALFFCVTYHNIMQLRLLESREIELVVEPDKSDFKHGKVIWQTEALNEVRTRLNFYSESTPSFWVPPLMGMVIWETRLTSIMHETLRNIECDYHQRVHCDIDFYQDTEGLNEPF